MLRNIDVFYKNSFNIEKGRQMFSDFKIKFQIVRYEVTGKVFNFLEKIKITKHLAKNSNSFTFMAIAQNVQNHLKA